jgi:murein L,D-transpeptidase YcbB/YkuD
LDRSFDNHSETKNSMSPRKFIFRSISEIYLKDTDM